MADRVKLTDLAAELRTYPRKLEGICQAAEITVHVDRHDGRHPRLIDRADVRKVKLFLSVCRRLKGVSKGRHRDLHSIPTA